MRGYVHSALRISLLLATSCCAVSAQTPTDDAPPPPPPPGASVISVKTQIVGVTGVVRGPTGEMVRNLDKADFVLKEDGKVQNVRYFTQDNDLPLMIGLLVDTSGSQRRYFEEQRAASSTFLKSMLTRSQDQGFVVRFDTAVLLLQRLTPDVSKLQDALGKLTLPHKPRLSASGVAPGTLLYDALGATAKEVIGKERGRRAIVVLTDGEDNGSIYNVETAIKLAQEADTAVYAAIYTDHDSKALNAFDLQNAALLHKALNGRSLMEKIALATGGRVFVVSKSLPIEQIYRQIEEDMRMQYRFGYTPAAAKPQTYHALELKTKDKHLTVQSRVGYYTPE